MRSPPSVRIWLFSALALSAIPAARRLAGGPDAFRLPATPLDRTNVPAARQWAFLQECRGRIPAGASLTVLGADPEEESALFMMALGAYPDHPVWPSSYFGTPAPQGAEADYVLLYRGAARPPGLEIVAEWDDGAVGRRIR